MEGTLFVNVNDGWWKVKGGKWKKTEGVRGLLAIENIS